MVWIRLIRDHVIPVKNIALIEHMCGAKTNQLTSVLHERWASVPSTHVHVHVLCGHRVLTRAVRIVAHHAAPCVDIWGGNNVSEHRAMPVLHTVHRLAINADRNIVVNLTTNSAERLNKNIFAGKQILTSCVFLLLAATIELVTMWASLSKLSQKHKLAVGASWWILV